MTSSPPESRPDSTSAPAARATSSDLGESPSSRHAAGRLQGDSQGLFAQLATPFGEDGSIDLESIRTQVEFHRNAGVSALAVLGSAAETRTLAHDECLQVVRAALKAADGQLPVLVMIPSGGLDNRVLFSRRVMDAGAAGVAVSADRGLHTDEAVYGYFDAIANRLEGIPWALHDDTAASGVHLATYLIIRMVQDFANLQMTILEEASGLDRITELREAQRQGIRRIAILAGQGALQYPLQLGRGADGVLAATAYPEGLVKCRELYAAGKRDDAEDVFDAYLPLLRHGQQPESGLAALKYLLARRKAIRTDRLRAPGNRLAVLDRQEADHLVRRLERRTRQLGIGQPLRNEASSG